MSSPRITPGLAGLAGAVLAGGVSAAFLAVALTHADTLLIFLSYLTAIPLFMAGLGAGSIAGLIASITGVAGLYMGMPSNFAVVYVFIFAVPAVALTTLALRYRIGADQKIYWYPEGYLLTAIALYPCVIFLAATALTSSYEGGLLALTTETFNEIATQVAKQVDANADKTAFLHMMLEQAAKIAPALFGCTWMLLTIISMVVAQSVLKQNKLNRRETFALRDLHVSNGLMFAVALTGLAGALTAAPYNYMGSNLAIMLGLPFLFVGIAVVHSWAATTRAFTLILVIFYLLLSLLPWLVLLVVALGVIDQWVNFRARLQRSHKPT